MYLSTQIKLSDWKPTFFAMALQLFATSRLTEDLHQLVDGHSPIVVFLVDLASGSVHYHAQSHVLLVSLLFTQSVTER